MFRPLVWPSSGWQVQEYEYIYIYSSRENYTDKTFFGENFGKVIKQ